LDFNGQLPKLLGNDEVAFFLDGDDDAPVSVAGSWNNWSTTDHIMQRGPGYRYLNLRVPPGHQVYKYYSHGHWFKDPHNQWVAWDGINHHGLGDFNSVLRDGHMIWLKRFPSHVLGDERDIFVMLPPGYDAKLRYPVLYMHDGNESITRAAYHIQAENAMRDGVCQPAIVVFVALPDQNVRNFQYIHSNGWPNYARFLAEELVPYIDTRFNTQAEPSARGVIGASLGGACSYYVALAYPDVFGLAAAQSGSFFVNGMDLLHKVHQLQPGRVRFYLDSSRPWQQSRGDMYRLASMMEQALQDAGHAHYHYHTKGDYHDWSFWANRFPAALQYLWPMPRQRSGRRRT
jgi:enterochelin esterase family protein